MASGERTVFTSQIHAHSIRSDNIDANGDEGLSGLSGISSFVGTPPVLFISIICSTLQ